MKRHFFLFAILVMLTVASCNLFPDELPEVSMGGLNTFGCKVDGKLFLPKAPLGYGAGVYVSVERVTDTVAITISALNSNTDQNLYLAVYDTPTIVVGKIYDLTSDPIFYASYTNYHNNPSCHYEEVISGTIVFSKVEIKNYLSTIVSGTFELSVYSDDCQKTVKITKGRFDVSDNL